MNHRWENNKCLKCGIERQKKEFKRWQRSESVLVNGIWQDRNIHTYGTAWHYGPEHKFERPGCKIKICHICGGENEHTKDCTSYMPQSYNQ